MTISNPDDCPEFYSELRDLNGYKVTYEFISIDVPN